jgi:hypothetical protein
MSLKDLVFPPSIISGRSFTGYSQLPIPSHVHALCLATARVEAAKIVGVLLRRNAINATIRLYALAAAPFRPQLDHSICTVRGCRPRSVKFVDGSNGNSTIHFGYWTQLVSAFLFTLIISSDVHFL